MIETIIEKLSPVRYKVRFVDETSSNDDIYIDIQNRISKTEVKNVKTIVVDAHTPCNKEITINTTIPFFKQIEIWITGQSRVKLSKLIKDFEITQIKPKDIPPPPTEYQSTFDKVYEQLMIV